jgi:hypothetical protein
VTGAREPGHVAGVTDDHRGGPRSDAVHVGDGAARRDDRDTDALDDGLELVVDATHVAEELERDAPTFDINEVDGTQTSKGLTGLTCAQTAAESAGNDQAEQGVEPTDRPGP